MLLFRFSVGFVILVTLILCVVGEQQYEKQGQTLFVTEDKQKSGGKVTVFNRNVESESTTLERQKRATTTSQTSPSPGNISTWTTHLNDSHQQLMVHWVGEGSKVIICLARDSTPKNNALPSPSALFISYDYGKNFTNKTENFRLGDTPDSGYAQVDKFFNHPKYPEFCVFADSANKKIYYTNDNGQNIHRSDLSFSPSELAFDEEFPDKYVILDKVDISRKLYLTLDGGKTFKMIQSYVKTFFWSSGPGFSKVFYIERWKPNGTSTVFSASDPTDLINADVLFEEAKDFQIKGDYMFATKQSKEPNNLQLYIAHQRGPFIKAEFQTELNLKKFHIADVTEKRLFVSVMHTESLANLYVSEIGRNFTQYNFVVSMEQILCYFPDGNWIDSWLEDTTEDPFTDLYRVEGLKGIYIASQVDSKALVAKIGPEHLVSLITFDHGVTWSPIKPPTEDENGKPLNCHIENSCSLHLCQKFSQLYPGTSPPGNVITNGLRSASIMSSKSAPGIIMATGVMGKSLKGIPGVYISRDAGLSWKRILKDFYFFNYGDHGGVLVVVKYFKSRGETRRILYSTNEGVEWNSYQFNADDLRIYGLMTEPGENTTTFTMFGSANDQHQWIIITINLKDTFARNCTETDYKLWSPSPPNSLVPCVLGSRNVFQRRLAHTDCYNGIDYQRPVKKEVCECTRRDYECDFGFMMSGDECVQNKSIRYDPYAVPKDCRPGQYYQQTKGYWKIDGNVCTVSGYSGYAPEMIPCPIEEPTEFMLVALRDKIARIDLLNNVTIYPVEGQNNILAIEFDIKNNCIYWADIELDRISRQCFNNGSRLESVVDTDLASIEGMALDWISNVLFFVDGLRKKIEAIRTDLLNEGRMRVTILDNKVLSKPRGIAVHPKAGYLFWTDWDTRAPSVSRSNLDGTDVKKLFGKPIVHWPNGITVDQMSERIYWVDAMEDYIASSDLNGQFLKRILWNNNKVIHPFAVAVLKDKIYWDDWKAKSIFIADKDTGLNVVTINSFSDLMDLKVFSHSLQYGTNACSFKNTSCDALCLGKPGNNSFSCLCPDGFKNVNGSCLCPDGVKPLANMTCPKTAGATCGPDHFACKYKDACIPAAWRCDGNNDCGDNSDEMGCLCSPPMIPCDVSSCYMPQWKCDGDIDCADMSDEKDCGKQNCTENQFQCDNGYCVEKRWICDGDNDCKDGSDERNCSVQVKRPDVTSCTGNGFTCGHDTALCVPYSWVCDGEQDCPSGSDEAEERCITSTCAPFMFRCPNGKCIFKTWVCDGENDCSDPEHSDEQNCTNIGHSKLLPDPNTDRPIFLNNVTCLNWMLQCGNGNCIPDWWRCDGIDDCGDHSDEVGCGLILPETRPINPNHPMVRLKCGKNQFTCSPGKCVPLAWVCDGTEDCLDGIDERDCAPKTRPAPICSADETPCADRKSCVKDDQLCDGISQCADRSDEIHCPTTPGQIPVHCPFGYMQCDKGRCLSQTVVCNGRQDCYDGTDEVNCSSSSDNRIYQFLSIGVDQSSINSTSFLISCWMAQQKMVVYSFLPSISKVSDGKWMNMSWTNDSTYRFTNLEPYTNYNITFYIKDSKSNKTLASNKYVNASTGEGVPSPPLKLTVRQLIGSRVQVLWNQPENPSGVIQYYELHYSPPRPAIVKNVPASNDNEQSIVIKGFFLPHTNYSFWMKAVNTAYTSNSSEVMYITFDEGGDVDDLSNVSMSRPNSTAVYLEWNKIRGVDGYSLKLRLPAEYAQRAVIETKTNNITVTNLPPGVRIYIDIQAFKNSIFGEPFTIPVSTSGEPDETLNLTAILLKEKKTSVQLTWSPPLGERYKNKELQYEVHYTNMIGRTNPGEMSNDTTIVTKSTNIEIDDLHACESYVFSVGLLGGPLSKFVDIITRENIKAPVKDLRVEINETTADMKITWIASCDALRKPVSYILDITEETFDKKSQYELLPTAAPTFKHIIHNVPEGGRYNVCISAAVEDAVVRCERVRARAVNPPVGVMAWIWPQGHLIVTWHDANTFQGPDTDKFKYQVLVSDKEIPENTVHQPDEVMVVVARSSPLPLTTPAKLEGPLYVSVRTINEQGYYSDLREVQALRVEDHLEMNAPTAQATVWLLTAGCIVAAFLLLAASTYAVVRRQRLARSFMRFSVHTPRYDTRRGQATITDQDDDDVPPIHGFSDDEPLVIA